MTGISRASHTASYSGRRSAGAHRLDRLALAIGLSWLAILAADVAHSQDAVNEAEPTAEERGDGRPDWIPSFGIGVGVHSQSISGDTSATTGDFPREDGDSLITGFFDFQGKLHTPLAVGKNDWLRLYLSAGVQIPLAEGLIAERIESAFNDEDPGFPANCPADVSGFPVTSCSLRIRNRVSIDAMWHLGFGLDFTLPVDESQFHILPAIEYYGMAVQTVGEFQRTSASGAPADLIEQANVVGDAEIFHGISPSLTFLADVYESGPWTWGMYLQGRAILLLDEPDLEANSSLGANNIRFISAIDDLALQFSGGIQIQWNGAKRRRR